MSKLALLALAGSLSLLAACAPKTAPAPVATAPKFPQFSQPPVPLAFAGSPATASLDQGWRFLQAGDFTNAEREMAAALKMAPTFYPAESASGYLHLARNDPKSALERFDRALELQGNYVSALMGRGQTLVALDREAEAIAAFGAALAVDPSLTELQRRIEVLRFRVLENDLEAARAAARAQKADQARRAYQAAIASSPESAFLYRELAAVERQAGAVDAAFSYFRKAVELDAADAASWAEIGGLLELRGDPQGALAAYGTALAIEASAEVEAKRTALVARLELAKLPDEYRAIDQAQQITRGDLAALIAVGLSELVQAMQSREQLVVVTDISRHWAEVWILAVARAGIIEPYANYTFQPGTLVRRADLAQAVSRLLPELATPAQMKGWLGARMNFSDVAAGHLAYPAASGVVASGVMTRAADGSFQPTRAVTGPEAIEAVRRLQAMAKQAAGRPRSGR